MRWRNLPEKEARIRMKKKDRLQYAELCALSNFSLLRGASHPSELIEEAARLGYHALALTDLNTIGGIVRAHIAAREYAIQFIVGSRLRLFVGNSFIELLVYPLSRTGYGALCRLLTTGNMRKKEEKCFLTLEDFLPLQKHFSCIALSVSSLDGPYTITPREFVSIIQTLRDNSPDRDLFSLSLTRDYGYQNHSHLNNATDVSRTLAVPLITIGDVTYHSPRRRPLQNLVTAIRLRTTVQNVGFQLAQNSERFLKPREELFRLYREYPCALKRTLLVAEQAAGFSLSSLRYEYPDEIHDPSLSPLEYLTNLVWEGAHNKYGVDVPEKITGMIRDELALIAELRYEKYFLTCADIVRHARSLGILCQGRGAAANSVVCFCLGITSVDPTQIDLLFARFVSRERNEPPDIDIDFEHERREEVIQYIYEKFGRERAGLTCEVISYRARSAVRDTGKALGLSSDLIEQLTGSIHRWTACEVSPDDLRELGLDPSDATIKTVFTMARELIGFPRHYSQHVGGFIISQYPLCETVPIMPAGMENRTIIEWDKNDIEELGMLKIDVLALGMLTCIRKAFDLINAHPRRQHLKAITMDSIPQEDPLVYDMVCRADTVGVFQIESRAQMSMLPRLKPRCFYDLVIEVAIVRPGPIQGKMVHPFLRRRMGAETISFPDKRVAEILGKTLGVPIFQEQAMRLAIVLANFSPDEAEKLRRAMAAWRSDKKAITLFQDKIMKGMQENGYSEEFAQTCINQIKGFSEYGFPESHAASFALLVYVSAWIKLYYPAEFACALLNSQPMGFYAPSQIVQDAKRHGVVVCPIDILTSDWDNAVSHHLTEKTTGMLRLGLRMLRGLPQDQTRELMKRRGAEGTLHALWGNLADTTVRKKTLSKIAEGDGFAPSLSCPRRQAHWEISDLSAQPTPLDRYLRPRGNTPTPQLPQTSLREDMIEDYHHTRLSLRAHPVQFLRDRLRQWDIKTAEELAPQHNIRIKTPVSVAGLVIVRQRPGTAQGVVFLTLEDETGFVNLIIRPSVFERHQKAIIMANVLLCHGSLQRIAEVIYVEAVEITDIDWMLHRNEAGRYDCNSYSY
jgi:error-prone DNA polymerase